MTKIYLIAGEASGDNLGGKLMHALKQQDNGLEFTGVGGPKMQAHGLISLFSMEELSIIGFLEIIPSIKKLLKRIEETVDDIIAQQPDVIVTIDAPAFNRRVAKLLRQKTGRQFKMVHYVAPSVWAYKPKRAQKMAKLFDHLLCLLPFEPPYFVIEGLDASFIGHAIVEDNVEQTNEVAFLNRHEFHPDDKVVGLFPGSRSGELKRHLPILQKAAQELVELSPNVRFVIVTTKKLHKNLEDLTQYWEVDVVVVSGENDKKSAIEACDIALVKSGTITLELALQQLPMIVFYKVNPLSAWMLRRMIQVEYVTLINILNEKMAVPEYLQELCTAKNLAQAAFHLLNDTLEQEHQKDAMQTALNMLGQDQEELPSQKAAKIVLEMAQKQQEAA